AWGAMWATGCGRRNTGWGRMEPPISGWSVGGWPCLASECARPRPISTNDLAMIEPREHLRPIYRTSERHEGRAEFVCLDRNERSSPLPDAVFRDLLASVSMRDLMAYPDAGALVSRLAHMLQLPEDWIAETAGSDNAIRRTFMAYLRPVAAVVAPTPSYAMYEIYMRIFQGVPRQIDYDAERRLDLDAFIAAVEPPVGIVVLANPDQPMG